MCVCIPQNAAADPLIALESFTHWRTATAATRLLSLSKTHKEERPLVWWLTMRERNTHTILSRVFLFLYSYERPRVKPKLVRKLSRRQQKQLNAKMEMNPSVFAVLIPQGHHLGCLHWGGGGACLLDLTIKSLGLGVRQRYWWWILRVRLNPAGTCRLPYWHTRMPLC